MNRLHLGCESILKRNMFVGACLATFPTIFGLPTTVVALAFGLGTSQVLISYLCIVMMRGVADSIKKDFEQKEL